MTGKTYTGVDLVNYSSTRSIYPSMSTNFTMETLLKPEKTYPIKIYENSCHFIVVDPKVDVVQINDPFDLVDGINRPNQHSIYRLYMYTCTQTVDFAINSVNKVIQACSVYTYKYK